MPRPWVRLAPGRFALCALQVKMISPSRIHIQSMAAAAVVVFAGKSVATATITFWINKAFTCLTDYCNAEGLADVKDKVLKSMNKVKVVLEVVSPEHMKEQSSRLDEWLWQFRDAMEVAEDAIDELVYYELKERAKDHKVSDWGSPFSKMKHEVVRSVKNVSILDKTLQQFTHRGILKRLRKAMEDLDKASTEILPILTVAVYGKNIASDSQAQVRGMKSNRDTGSTLASPYFVGREMEKKMVADWLTMTPVEASEIVTSTDHVPIFSVVGHGGMGKTTLAQCVCEEENIAKKFKVIWVHVSTIFDPTSVTSKILESLTGTKPNADNLEALQQNLKKKLKSVRFLLVLDDVWEDKEKYEWENIFAPLRKGMSGSKILLTTRMRSVADMASNAMGVKCEFLELEGLKEADNLKLFNHHVFCGRNPQDFSDLIEVGKQIAKAVRGCPLVTKVISGHLQDNMSFEYWNHFLHEGLERFQGTEDGIMKILRLSYYHLPTELQICFRYCSLFPQGYKFQKKDLVLMWIGSGLISQAGNGRIEDIGGQILSELTRNSFFDMKFKIIQYSQRKEEYYVMHDLMHELARHISSGECATVIDPSMLDNEMDTVRHLRIACIQKASIDEIKKITRFKNLRSIIIDGPGFINKDILHAVESIIESSKSLRLLRSDLQNTYQLPKLGDLKHLRYFSLYRISPKVICGLVKLYHLLIVDCLSDWKQEPRKLRYLGNIDHLRYVNYGRIGEFPIGRLTSLQELCNYRVQGSRGNKVSAIENLKALRKLEVLGLENVESLEEADRAKLHEKQYLKSLSLMWSARGSIENSKDDLILDHLEPHANIRNLKISGYAGARLPIWIENLRVKNLVSLELAMCIYWEHLPSLGELILLKKLWLECLPSLQVIGSYFPPNLETLIVRRCKELKQLPVLPPSLVHLEISKVGLAEFPRIGSLHGENIGTKPSKLHFVSVEDCASLEGSLLLQAEYTKAIHVLRITDCKGLESVPLLFKEMSELRELSITNYPKLRASSEVEGKILPLSLENLTIKHSGDLECSLIKSLHGLSNLSELVLENCLSLESLPPADVCKSLKSLKFMEIIGCENLQSFGGLGSLGHLIALKVIACSKLTDISLSVTSHESAPASVAAAEDDCIEEENLVASAASLQIDYLEVDFPSTLNIEPLKSLCHTKGLIIRDGTQMERLPEQWLLQNHNELQSLKVFSANSLESLPMCMRELSSLNVLLLSGAGKLRSLPDLPSSLQWIHVMGCRPELETNVRVKDSPEWNKISHIPKVHIAAVKIDQSGRPIFHAGYYFMSGKECSEDTIYGRSIP